MNKVDFSKLIYSGKYTLPLDSVTKRSYKILLYRSTISHGKIESITVPELPENYYIINGTELKSRNRIKILDSSIPLLADEIVNYIGEPILLIVGIEIKTLLQIHNNIKVEYSPLPTSEEIFYSRSITLGNNDEAFATPYKTVSGTINTPNSVIQNKFLHGSFTKRESESFIVYSSDIWPSLLQENLSSICMIESEKIKIVNPAITGEDEYPLLDSFRSSVFTTLSASILKKNVMYAVTPEDQYLYSSKQYGLKVDWKLAFDKENVLQGITLDGEINCGAYPVFAKEKVLRVIHGLTSYYKHRNISINVKAVKSFNPPGGISKGLYLPDALFAAELLVSKIIKESKDDQFLWRDKNLLRKGYRNSTFSIIKKDLPFPEMLKNIVAKSDFSRKNSSINLSLLRKEKKLIHSPKRGIGISIGYNGNAFLTNCKSLSTYRVTVQLNRDGKVDLYVNTRLNNLELLNIWEKTISESLNIKGEDIIIETEECSKIEDSGPNIENVNISIFTQLIRQCCDEIKLRRFKDPLPIKQTKTTRKKSSLVWDQEDWKGCPFKNNSYAVCAVEVEIDKKSLNCIIKDVWLEIEVGQILHKQSLINSLVREINSTIKWLQQPEPQIINGKFDLNYYYNNINNNQKPEIHISFFETGKNKNTPKGVGSLIKNTLPGAYIQGINQALGANINTFPISKDVIFREISIDEI